MILMNVGIKLDVHSHWFKHQDLRRANDQRGVNLSSFLSAESYFITVMKRLIGSGNIYT